MRRYMVIEDFTRGGRHSVYQRFNEKGRLLPDGLLYIDSWVEKDGNRCYQLMQTDNPALFDAWFERWADLVDFELIELDD